MASAARLGSRLDAVFLVGCVVLSFVAIMLPTEASEPVASVLRRTVVAPLVSMQRGAERWRAAWVSSERRQMATDSLALRAVRAQALDVENEQLRKLIGLGSKLQWGFVPAEALHSTAPIPSEDIVTTLTLTTGSNSGVRRYSPVIAPEGLVGQIKTVDPTTSIAILYSDPDFRASAMTADGTGFGIVYPHQANVKGPSDSYMLELRGVPSRTVLQPGTIIVTSGLGGVFPRGVPIGTVVRDLRTSEVWTKTYLVRPAVSPSHVNAVLVLTAQRVTQGVGNVWGSVVNADSATRRIVSAGDSLAAQAALVEAQARRAALDSVKKATLDSVRRVLGLPDSARLGQAPGTRDSVGAVSRPPAAFTRPASPTGTFTPRPKIDTSRRDSARIRPDTLRTPRP